MYLALRGSWVKRNASITIKESASYLNIYFLNHDLKHIQLSGVAGFSQQVEEYLPHLQLKPSFIYNSRCQMH